MLGTFNTFLLFQNLKLNHNIEIQSKLMNERESYVSKRLHAWFVLVRIAQCHTNALKMCRQLIKCYNIQI